MSKITLQERCNIAAACLPDAPYRTMLMALHGEMNSRIEELEAQLSDAKQVARYEADVASQAIADFEVVKAQLAGAEAEVAALKQGLHRAHRLRELDKPDCIYTLCADDSPTPQTLESGCGGATWYLGDDGKGAYPKFCHHCQGAVKSGGLANE